MDFELKINEPEDTNEPPIQWAKWYEEVKEHTEYIIKVDRLTFRDNEQPVFFAVNEAEKVGISIFAAHHPNAVFTDATPHGIRLANAIGRAFNHHGTVSADELCDLVNNHDNASICVKKTEKGILWTVVLVKKSASKKQKK